MTKTDAARTALAALVAAIGRYKGVGDDLRGLLPAARAFLPHAETVLAELEAGRLAQDKVSWAFGNTALSHDEKCGCPVCENLRLKSRPVLNPEDEQRVRAITPDNAGRGDVKWLRDLVLVLSLGGKGRE